MEAYRLYTVVPRLVDMIEQLCNWYIRMNKDRFSGGAGDADRMAALATLFEVLLIMCRMMAPLTPARAHRLLQHERVPPCLRVCVPLTAPRCTAGAARA